MKTVMPPAHVEALKSWHRLNKALFNCTEKFANELLEMELKGQRRQMWLKRIHARINRLRAIRERKALARRAHRPTSND